MIVLNKKNRDYYKELLFVAPYTMREEMEDLFQFFPKEIEEGAFPFCGLGNMG